MAAPFAALLLDVAALEDELELPSLRDFFAGLAALSSSLEELSAAAVQARCAFFEEDFPAAFFEAAAVHFAEDFEAAPFEAAALLLDAFVAEFGWRREPLLFLDEAAADSEAFADLFFAVPARAPRAFAILHVYRYAAAR